MKDTSTKIIFVFVLCMCSARNLCAKEWRGIVPLKSSRGDVERLLGAPNTLGRYQFDKERAYIDYAKGCDQMNDCLCLVPKDTVISIFVTLENDLKIADLKLNLTKFMKTRGTHLPGMVNYTNEEDGISYTVDEDDNEVTHIAYLPTRRDCRRLVNRARVKKPIRFSVLPQKENTQARLRVPSSSYSAAYPNIPYSVDRRQLITRGANSINIRQCRAGGESDASRSLVPDRE